MTNQSPFLDEETISNMKELGNGDGDFSERLLIVQLMFVYLENLPDRIAELNQGMNINDAHLVERAAHTLKSSSRLIGLISLAEDCQILEDFGFSKDLSQAKEVYNRILKKEKKAKTVIAHKIKLIESGG